MSAPVDDWDEPRQRPTVRPVPRGYRDAGADWTPRQPQPRPLVPASTRILVLADIKVRQFCERPGIELDLPGAVAACLHLVRHTGFLAATSMEMAREADGLGEIAGAGPDLRDDFGPHIEAAMESHADWLLDRWYLASQHKR